MSNGGPWFASHTVTALWSNPGVGAIAFALAQVPSGSVFRQLAERQGSIPVHYFGNAAAEEGDIWVDAQDVDATDAPASVAPELTGRASYRGYGQLLGLAYAGRVNGGLNGWGHFVELVHALEAL